MKKPKQNLPDFIVDVDQLINDYEKINGVHEANCGLHYKNGANAILSIKKDCIFTLNDMKKCFIESRKAYIFKNGCPSVHANFETFIETFKTKK